MLDLRFALFAQYPAFFLLSVLFLINYLIVRKRSAVKSVLWVILFGLMLAVSILFAFLGLQSKYWTLGTLFTIGVWSWIGIGLVIVAMIVRFVFKLKGKIDRHTLDRELKKAEKDKDAAVAQAREEGRAEAMASSAPQVEAPVGVDASDTPDIPADTSENSDVRTETEQ